MTRLVCLAALLTARAAGAYPVEVLQSEGDPANRVDLAILGDGYRDVDQTKLTDDANAFLAELWAEVPFQQYQRFFNVKLVKVVSNENGADDGSYGAVRDTALGAYYYCDGLTERLLCADSSAVNTEAGAHVPEYDLILLVVNDPKYGGSGGSYAVFSVHGASGQIAVHEMGHSYANLADEYEDPYPGYPPCGSECPEPNATLQTDRAQIKWNAWIDGATPVPTPETAAYLDSIGVFEGARYETTGVYRPKQDCMMRSLGIDFCSVCSEADVLATYDLVDPIDAAAPVSPLTLAMDDSVVLSVARLQPAPDSLVVRWVVDGSEVAVGQDAYAAEASVLGPGDHVVTAEASDETSLVRNDPLGLLVSQRSWTVTVCEGPLDAGGTNDCGGGCELLAPAASACDGPDSDLCADDARECVGPNTTECPAGADDADPCDGIDGDCDGTTDNDGSNACGGSCGLATAPGGVCDGPDSDLCADDVQVCAGPNATACPVGADDVDLCDGLDNDCDGTTDNEGSNACGGSCALAAAPGGACDGLDGDLCADDVEECAGLNATVCSLGADDPDLCDGLDNDCDGATDNDGSNACGGSCALSAPPGDPCDGPDGDLCADDTTECAGPNATACAAGTDDIERCDGIDNDCDGAVDEDFAVGRTCSVGVGACAATGALACAADGTAACSAHPLAPGTETCNGLDDDCDGIIDDPDALRCAAGDGDGGCGCRVASAPENPDGSALTTAMLLVAGLVRLRRIRTTPPRK